MRCSQCGNDVAGSTEVCPSCGTRLTGDAGRADIPAGVRAGQPGPASAYRFDAGRWTVSDRIVGVASLVVLISLFLPWFSVTVSVFDANLAGVSAGSASESGTSAHGWLWFAFIISLVIMAYLILRAGYTVLPFQLPFEHELGLLVAAGLNLLLIFIAFVLKPGTGIAGIGVNWSFGAILALVAAIAAVGSVVLARRYHPAASSGPDPIR